MNEAIAVDVAAQPVRWADRIGIITRLLVGSLLAMLVAVACVQYWTLGLVETNGLQREQALIDRSVALLKHELVPLGAAWSTAPDGQLMLGTTKVSGRNDLVDAVLEVSGAVATIFQGDTRIVTSVRNSDGSRAIGTSLADAVLRDGHIYRGTAMILGKPHLTIYEPVRDAQARTVGILFVGAPLADQQAFIATIVRESLIGTLVIAVLCGLAYFWVLRATIRPVTNRRASCIASLMELWIARFPLSDGLIRSARWRAHCCCSVTAQRALAPWRKRRQHCVPVPRPRGAPPWLAWQMRSRLRPRLPCVMSRHAPTP